MVSRNFILANATIIDVEKGSTFKGVVEVGHGYIQKIFTEGSTFPTGKEVINMEGKYIIPGLIDMHCHIKEGFAPQFVASGVTTVRNTAGNVFQLKKLMEAPLDAPTPKVYSADRMIDGPPGLWGPTSYGNFVTDDPEKARQEVKRQQEAGAQFIKVYGWLSKKVMEVVVSEADTYGLEVSCDIVHSSEVNALDAAKIGVKWFEHASGFLQAIYPNWHTQAPQEEWDKIDWDSPDKERIEKLCRQMLTYDVKLCPTLVITDQIASLPGYWYPNNPITKTIEGKDGLKSMWEGMIEQHEAALKKQLGALNNFTKEVAMTYARLGGTVVTGTDTPGGVWTIPGMAMHRELELFVEIGFTEMEALQAATIKAAQSIDMQEVGVIKKGMIADMVILDRNPLEDIRHTKDIDTVIKGGHIYTQEDILTEIPSDAYLKEQNEKFLAEFESMSDKS